MKQHITVEQLDELSDKAFRRLNKWVFKGVFSDANDLKIKGKKGRYYAVTTEDGYFLSIGQMIEFLIENDSLHGDEDGRPALPTLKEDWKKYICDDLWEAVKEILNE